jgi:hypothetical protein
MPAPTAAAPMAPATKLEANPKIIADAAAKPTHYSQHRLIPRIRTNLLQMETDKTAVMNTVAKMKEVARGLAAKVYLTQKGVPKVYTPVVNVRKVTATVNNKKGRSFNTSPKAPFRFNGGAFRDFGSSLFRMIPRKRAIPDIPAKLIAIGTKPNLAYIKGGMENPTSWPSMDRP